MPESNPCLQLSILWRSQKLSRPTTPRTALVFLQLPSLPYRPSAQSWGCSLPASISSPKLDASGDFLPTRLAKYSGLATKANVLQNSFWECKEGSEGCHTAAGSTNRHGLTAALGPRSGPLALSRTLRGLGRADISREGGEQDNISQKPRGGQKRDAAAPR